MAQCTISSVGAGNFIGAVFASNQATELVEAGEIDEGLALFDQAIAMSPPGDYLGSLHLLRGAVLTTEGRHDAALADFDFAVENGSTYPPEAFRRRANLLALLGYTEDALSDMRAALEAGEEPAYAQQRIIGLLIALGREEEAEAVPFEGLSGSPDSRLRMALAHAELAVLLGDFEAAQCDVEAADAIEDYDDPELALERAVIRKRLGLEPATPKISATLAGAAEHWAKAAFAWLIDGTSDGETAFAAITGRRTECSETRCILRFFAGSLAEQAGDKEAALTHCCAALEEPDARWLMEYGLAQRTLARLDPKVAAAVQPKIILRRSSIPASSDSTNPEPLATDRTPEYFSERLDAAVQHAMERPSEGIDALTRIQPELFAATGLTDAYKQMMNGLILTMRGKLRRFVGHASAAVADLRTARKISAEYPDLDTPDLSSDYFFALIESGEIAAAKAEMSAILENAPDVSPALLLRGVLAFAEGHLEDAGVDLQAAMKNGADHGIVLKSCALFHLINGELEAAVKCINAAQLMDSSSSEIALGALAVSQRVPGVSFGAETLGKLEGPDFELRLLEHAAGRADRDAVLNAAVAERVNDHRCQLTIAHFYLGVIALSHGDVATARRDFEAVLEKGVAHLIEFGAARRELAALGN
jgi:tetratricopeptide (TPR) repeat protein